MTLKTFLIVGATLSLSAFGLRGVLAHDGEIQSTSFEEKEVYLNALSAYGQLESTFLISRDQYLQVQTLAALEQAVKDSTAVQLMRTETMIHYFQSLDLLLFETQSVELSRKEVAKNLLTVQIADLEEHRNKILAAKDRIALDAVSSEFEQKQIPFTQTAFQVLALVKIARIQTALDNLQAASERIYTVVKEEQKDATKLATAERGFDELKRTQADIQALVGQANLQYENYAREKSFSSGTYQSLMELVSPSHAKLRQAHNFLTELSGGK